MLPTKIVASLQLQLVRAITLWAKDRAAARHGVQKPDALDRKCPRAGSHGRGTGRFNNLRSRPIREPAWSAATTFYETTSSVLSNVP